MVHVSKTVTIKQSPEAVYQFWRQLDNLPQFMQHIEAVRVTDPRHSHWVAKAPGGTIEWDAEITDDVPNERLAWQSVHGAEIENRGIVRFRPAPADRGTEVQVDVYYDAPGGTIGTVVAKWFGEEPQQQVRDDLRRFKQVMETGEVVRSEGSLDGMGQGALKQRKAQAPEAKARVAAGRKR
jgi:uncharacterized membrane protein